MAEHFLDCIGEACPVPLIKAKQELAGMHSGDVLTINVDHTCAIKNIPDYMSGLGYPAELKETGEGEWDIVVKKT
ncbi:MAG: sulfurtransferase TusA family protein [Spirochaetaceae bacterium]|jgi:TusA-related sulfurtransferase|nr:sulfurtransferase TusA family protein [Spirochaetaceae bacterium]